MKKLQIRDVTLRDGQQSLFATRMKQKQVDKVLPLFKEAKFYAMEVWGGAVPDSVMRYLNENPWTRLETIKKEIGDVSYLTALSRGRNLFGYNPYPEDTIEGFNRNSVKSGIGIMRIFDALNDVDNMKSTIKYVKENGGMADCVVCYTIDPKFSSKDRWKSFITGKKLPNNIFTTEYFVNKATELEKLGADMITIKDMAGLIPPSIVGVLIREFKKNLNIPVDFHTHCTPGYGLAASVMAIVNGVDIIDTAIIPFAGGPAAPAYEHIQILCDKMGIETGVDINAVSKISKELFDIRRNDLKEFDSYQDLPIEFDIANSKLPAEIDTLFDKAIEYAKADNEVDLLDVCHQIENYFGFPPPNTIVRDAEIPGGMYTNMLAQLKQLQLDHLVNRVMELVPMVRVKAGCPPLVTPTSQIVGQQAVNCVIDENNGDPFFSNVSVQFNNLVKGLYGKTPTKIDPAFREKICGHREEMPFDPKSHVPQENPELVDFGNVKLAENEKEELLLELFPAVARGFLTDMKRDRFNETVGKIQKEEQERIRAEREAYNKLSAEEKRKRLIDGLYHYNWDSSRDWDKEDEKNKKEEK